MSDLVGIGTIRYGEFVFRGPRVSSELSLRPVTDRAGRTITGVEYTLNVHAWITADRDEDGNWALAGGTPAGSDTESITGRISIELTTYGQELEYSGVGLTDGYRIHIDGSNSCPDIAWGPKPELLTFKPVGLNNVWEIRWSVKFIRHCCADHGEVTAMNYAVDYGVDARGLTTRTIHGYLEISNGYSRVDAINQNRWTRPATVHFTPDEKTEEWVTKNGMHVPLGWRREHVSRRISDDRRTMEFTVVDRELPGRNAFPPGIVDADISHTARTSKRAWYTIENTLSGWMEVAKNLPPGWAWEKFLLILRERILMARERAWSVILNSIQLTENLFSNRVMITVTWDVFLGKDQGSADLGTFLHDCGIFEPLKDSSHESWAASMKGLDVWSGHGICQLRDNAEADLVFNPCRQDYRPLRVNPSTRVVNAERYRNGNITNDCKPTQIDWKSSVEVINGNSSVTHIPMLDNSPPQEGDYIPGNAGQHDNPRLNLPSDAENVVVQSTDPAKGGLKIRLKGHGVRIGERSKIPHITEAFGQEVTRENIDLSESKVEYMNAGTRGGCPVYLTKWDIIYTIPMRQALDRINLDDIIVDPDGGVFWRPLRQQGGNQGNNT